MEHDLASSRHYLKLDELEGIDRYTAIVTGVPICPGYTLHHRYMHL